MLRGCSPEIFRILGTKWRNQILNVFIAAAQKIAKKASNKTL